MCGIGGFIGASKKPALSIDLAALLLTELEIRGGDACGFWASKEYSQPFTRKEPMTAGVFIETPAWYSLKKYEPDALILHSRYSSFGVMQSYNNVNNHPFVSDDGNIGLVHNGRIPEAENFKDTYRLDSTTDSEILLRMYEEGIYENHQVSIDHRQKVLCGIYQTFKEGSLAIAIGEKINNYSHVFLMRNGKKPLWFADLTESLGQVFFFSTPEIWFSTVDRCKRVSELKDHCKMYPLDTGISYHFLADLINVSTRDNVNRCLSSRKLPAKERV